MAESTPDLVLPSRQIWTDTLQLRPPSSPCVASQHVPTGNSVTTLKLLLAVAETALSRDCDVVDVT